MEGQMDEYDEDEELLMVTGSRSKSAGKKRHRKASDSEDDEERPARAAKVTTNQRRAAAADSDDNDDDAYGMDAEERQKLAGMNELEREMYLFEREERLQRQREREQVINQARKEQEQVEVRASSRRKQAATGADSAIGKIAAAHAQREERAKKKKQEEEEKQEQQRRERQQQQEEEEEAEEEEDEYEGEEDEEELEPEYASADEGLDELGQEADELVDSQRHKQLGARAEAYDENTGSYEEAEERATLEDIKSITLRRSDLEAWYNEPFFEEDVRGCVLRIVAQQAPKPDDPPRYMMCRIADVVVRNSYAFPTTTKNSRTRKWLHLDDLSGHGVFRHQMTMVSNSPITEQEYNKALAKAEAAHTKFITKGDVEQAKERLQHARSFKYDSTLVKKMLEKKRAAGKLAGSTAQIRARLRHELNVARQDGQPEEAIQRIQAELSRLEQQEVSIRQGYDDIMQQALQETNADRAQELASQLPTDMALALINMRNKKINNYKLVTAGVAKTAAAEAGGGARDVFARRHTQSKVYWSTKRKDGGDVQQQEAAPAAQLVRQGSGITEVSLLKGDKKNMDPAELIKVLELTIDMSRLPQAEPGRAAEAMLPKRLLGLRWMQSVNKRQQELAGRNLLTLDDWKRKMDLQQKME